jgi:glycosyltransferase involved in cell wall biosynthesis
MAAHVVYYEPDYSIEKPNLWQLRGQYKYPSIIGDLHRNAQISILMHTLPPRRDRFRRQLEADFGVNFVRIERIVSKLPQGLDALRKALSRALGRISPTVLSNLNGRTISYSCASALAARDLGIRYVARIGGDDLATKASVAASRGEPFMGTWRYQLYLSQERLAAELADCIIVMTKREKARLSRIISDPQKIVVCYRGIDPMKFQALSARKAPCRRFLFVGRRSPEKGYDICEAVARRVWAENRQISFTFAGTFDKAVEENRQYVGFVPVDELSELYSAHDALIVCSRSEGLPQVVMEAMSMGLPCILSRHLFEHDFVDGTNALLRNADVESMTAAVFQLAADDHRFEELAKRALRHATENFSAAAMNSLYRRIMLQDSEIPEAIR